MNIHPERYLEPFILNETEFGEELRRRGWNKICEKPVNANMEMVREFYLHIDYPTIRRHHLVEFRGHDVSISYEVINDFFGIPEVETTAEGISEHVAAIPAEQVIVSLRTDRQFAEETTHADLDYESAVWNLFISHNMTPLDTHTFPTNLRFRVIYSLRNQEPLNFGRLMFLSIATAGFVHLNTSLVFPHFITEILRANDFNVGGETVACGMIGLQSINKIRGKRNLQRIPNARERLRAARRAARGVAVQDHNEAPAGPAAEEADAEDNVPPPPPHQHEAGPSRPHRGETSLLRQVLDNQALMFTRLDRMEANQQELRTAQQQLFEQQQRLQGDMDYLRDAFRYSTGYQRRRRAGQSTNGGESSSGPQDPAPDA